MQDFQSHMIAYLEARHVGARRRGASLRYEAMMEREMRLAFIIDSLSAKSAARLEMEIAALPFERKARQRAAREMARLNRVFILRDGFGLKLSPNGEDIRLARRVGRESMERLRFAAILTRFIANGRRARIALSASLSPTAPDAAPPQSRVYL